MVEKLAWPAFAMIAIGSVPLRASVSNPAEDADRPKVRQRKGHDLSPAQVQLVSSRSRARSPRSSGSIALTFVLTGIRNADLRAMRWRDVDLIENRLAIPDSKSDDGVR